jgi:hypothetical protein
MRKEACKIQKKKRLAGCGQRNNVLYFVIRGSASLGKASCVSPLSVCACVVVVCETRVRRKIWEREEEEEDMRDSAPTHLIKLGKRTFVIERLVIFHRFFTLTLNNYVVHDHIRVHALPYLRL